MRHLQLVESFCTCPSVCVCVCVQRVGCSRVICLHGPMSLASGSSVGGCTTCGPTLVSGIWFFWHATYQQCPLGAALGTPAVGCCTHLPLLSSTSSSGATCLAIAAAVHTNRTAVLGRNMAVDGWGVFLAADTLPRHDKFQGSVRGYQGGGGWGLKRLGLLVRCLLRISSRHAATARVMMTSFEVAVAGWGVSGGASSHDGCLANSAMHRLHACVMHSAASLGGRMGGHPSRVLFLCGDACVLPVASGCSQQHRRRVMVVLRLALCVPVLPGCVLWW